MIGAARPDTATAILQDAAVQRFRKSRAIGVHLELRAFQIAQMLTASEPQPTAVHGDEGLNLRQLGLRGNARGAEHRARVPRRSRCAAALRLHDPAILQVQHPIIGGRDQHRVLVRN